MKKTFIRFCLLILALVVVSCSKDESINYHTELSLEEPHYILGNVVGDTVIVAIVTEGKAASTVRIPYRLSSSSNAVSVSYTHLTLPTNHDMCRSRWSPYH